MSYLLAFIGFASLILLHEAGHFVAAKAVGMRVERFSLFFGPMFIKRRRGETEYGVGVIPLGGYVKITGMTPGEEFETPEIEARAYFNQPVWKRIVVIIAGPATNILIAFVIVWVLAFSSLGHVVTTDTVYGVLDHSPAASVLKPGDRIVSVDGVRGSANRLRTVIEAHRCAGAQVNGCRSATPVRLVVDRHGTLRAFEVYPRYNAADGVPLIGFEFGERQVSSGPIYAVGQSASGLWRATAATASAIGRIFQAKERRQLHSVVGAADLTQQAISTSSVDGWEIIALISLSLGIINLLPFLPLDGGHIFWALAEKVRGAQIPVVVIERAGFIGLALILGLFLIGLTNDISGISHGTLSVR